MKAIDSKTVTKGCLYLVPNTLGADTLIGSLPSQVQEITRTIRSFVGENAKATRAFLKLLGTAVPIQDIEINILDVNTADKAVEELLAPLLAGEDVGLVSDAGCPAVADPGARLVRLAHEHGILVRPLVGPNSILLALMASGLNGQSFAFHGYLPTDPVQRAERLRALESLSKREHQTQIFIETPYRNVAMVDAISKHLSGNTRVCVATDITLESETITTLAAPKWADRGALLQKRPSVFLMLAD